MYVRSRHQRGGDWTVVAFGAESLPGGGLRADVLYIANGAPRKAHVLVHPESGTRFPVRLPDEWLEHPEVRVRFGVTLEASA